MMKRALWILLALSLGLNAGLLYVRLADRPGMAPGSHPGESGPHGPPPGEHGAPQPDTEALIRNHLASMSRHLDLSVEQQQSIEEILRDHLPEMAELRRRAEEANRRVSAAFAERQLNSGRFTTLVREASQARARIDSLSAVMLLGEAGVLSPAQRARFAEVAPTVYANPRRSPPPRRP
jgi:Spy/CpxP family protein refolding chaperone